MLTKSKQKLLLSALKDYHKKYLKRLNPELDESGTRIMINALLTDVLGFMPIDEVKTEQLIRGAYADYVIQLKGKRYFLVEAKKQGIDLSEKHLRQARQYCADEGIEWALLTNGKHFELYKIILESTKPIKINDRKVFSIDLGDLENLKENVQLIQFLHKISVSDKGLDLLWDKCVALDPKNIAGLLYTPPVANFIKGQLRKKYKHQFSDEEIEIAIDKVVQEAIPLEEVATFKVRKSKRKNTNGENHGPNSDNQIVNVTSPTIIEQPKPTV
ncbi:hypothetical protein BH11BAC1_BH11BAC1_04540 [soil metagenome]